ncbi:MAG: histidine kinase, partial [candidate division Zixibacteria bacterium]|nr:histidine kinase [candidate division Zixibacteria bacterium]
IDFAIEDKTLRERLKSTLEKKETGYQYDFELPGDVSGRPRIMRARTSLILDRSGKESGIITIILDVTHEREIDRMKSEFISTAAHELRTPLTSIQGFSEILLCRQNLGSKEKKKFLNYINRQSICLAKIISDLLDISRIESGRGFTLERADIDFGRLIEQIISKFREQSELHRFQLNLQPSHNLLIDEEKMGQVLENLLSNAIKYSPEGGLIRIKSEVID